ncbi:MAG: hypothetical protein LW701_07805 [Fluviicola sp.]|jgi:hypothetical protein|nr:hypothetical protein [Fluviicola sp.]
MRLLIILIQIALPLICFGQINSINYFGKEIIIDNRVKEHYSIEYFNDLKVGSPELLVYQNYFVQHAFKIVDLSEKAKEENYIKLSQIPKIVAENYSLDYSGMIEKFNILNFEIVLKDTVQVIDLEYDNKFIIIKTKEDFLNSFNDYKAKQLN